jgi:suppressor of ftsI
VLIGARLKAPNAALVGILAGSLIAVNSTAGAQAATTTKRPATVSAPDSSGMGSMAGIKMDSGSGSDMTGMAMGGSGTSATGLNRMVPMPKGMPMMAGMEGSAPSVIPFLPGAGVDPATFPLATPRQAVALASGDTLKLDAGLVRRTINGRTFVMYGFNGQYPGPLIRVKQNTTITVVFTNHIDLPSAVHWHGLRQDNRFDGVPGLTQDPVLPGKSFVYTVHFPDAGIYWYHPHLREDVEQGLGLFGNMIVDSPDPAYYSPVNSEQVLMLDDLLIDKQGIFPFGHDAADFTIMGRMGNVLLVNGEPRYNLTVHKGDVVRFFLTDVSNARSWNLSMGGLPIKVVAADVSKFDHEVKVPNVTIIPAQRYVVEVRFDQPGVVPLTQQVQGLNNFLGEFFSEVDTLGAITVSPDPSPQNYSPAFDVLRANKDVIDDIQKYRQYFDKPPDKSVTLTVNIQGLPIPIVAFMSVDTMYFPPVEWNDGMPDMNWIATSKQVKWIIRDDATGKENENIDWHFKQGDVVKIRMRNDGESQHPMGHPMHFHGQRFLVVARNGVPNQYLAWKDTELVPVGQTVDILLDASNPGKWMAHCHIAEHLEAGMHMMFTVDPAS